MAILLLPLMTAAAQKTPSSEVWLTKADRSVLFEKQDKGIIFTHQQRNGAIIIDDRQSYQSVDGFGFALTGGSAFLIHRMSQEVRTQLLKELFEKNDKAIGVSYLRLTIGASDMNSFVYSYDDMKAGESDPELKHFSLGHDMDDVIPVMKEILAINPNIKILASPWSAPAWMKTNGKVKGGALKAECYDVYAQYLVKYLQEMKKQGITIDAITVQNEPLNSNNTPSMPMSYIEEGKFIRDYFGPQLEKAQVKVKIVLFDHNLDRPDYPLAILNNPATAQYVDGSGFHHYAGSMSTMSFVHAAHPEKNLYFTEMSIGEWNYSFAGDLMWNMKKYKSILWSLIALVTFNACNNENYSEPPVEGTPVITLKSQLTSAMFGDSLTFNATATDAEFPLSTLKAQLFFGTDKVSETVLWHRQSIGNSYSYKTKR